MSRLTTLYGNHVGGNGNRTYSIAKRKSQSKKPRPPVETVIVRHPKEHVLSLFKPTTKRCNIKPKDRSKPVITGRLSINYLV